MRKEGKKNGFMQRHKEKVQKKKTEEAKSVIAQANSLANLLEDSFKNINKDKEVDLSQVKNEDLLKYIKEARELLGTTDFGQIEQIKEKVISEHEKQRKKQIEYIRSVLNEIQTSKVKDDLRKYTNLSETQIEYLIYGVRTNADSSSSETQSQQILTLGNDGKLEISKEAPIKLEDIKGTPLEEELRILAIIPRVTELTGEEVLKLFYCMSINDGKITVDFSKICPTYRFYKKGGFRLEDKDIPILYNGELNEQEVKKEHKFFYKLANSGMNEEIGRLRLFRFMQGTEMYSSYIEKLFETARENYNRFGEEKKDIYPYILAELDSIIQLSKVETLKTQLTEFECKLSDLEKPNLTKKEKRIREILKEEAELRVNIIARTCSVSRMINSQTGKEEYIIKAGSAIIERIDLDHIIEIRHLDDYLNNIEERSHDEK